MTFPAPTSAPAPLPAPVRWRLSWRGRTFREEEMTGRHLSVIAVLNGADEWSNLDVLEVSPLRGPVRLMTVLSAFLVIADGVADAEGLTKVLELVAAAPAEELLAALHVE